MAEAPAGHGSKLFVRQSSGLVRDVSVTNAMFFNIAAFVGAGLTLSVSVQPGVSSRTRHAGPAPASCGDC